MKVGILLRYAGEAGGPQMEPILEAERLGYASVWSSEAYGSDAESDELSPLYIGSTSLVRGYASGAFDVDECTQVDTSTCPEFDRLNGSRLAVASIEFRIPFIGTERFGLIDGGGALPIDLAVFADAGAAWTQDENVEWKFDRDTTERVPVFSVGGTMRTNLLGNAVVELYYAYPFQRHTGWEFGMQLAPGW